MKKKTIYIPLAITNAPPIGIYKFGDFLCQKLLEVAASVNVLNEDYKCDFFMECFEVPKGKIHGICISYSNPYLFENFSKLQMQQVIQYMSKYIESQILPKCLTETTQAAAITKQGATHHRVVPQREEEMLKRLRKVLGNVFQGQRY